MYCLAAFPARRPRLGYDYDGHQPAQPRLFTIAEIGSVEHPEPVMISRLARYVPPPMTGTQVT